MSSPITLPDCDYLVVGAGASSLAFVDTLLKNSPTLQIVLVDRHSQPGGHWNDAYPHVWLHQPSFVYGVEGRLMEPNTVRPFTRFEHRSGKEEILRYFGSVVATWEQDKQVSYYPCSEFDNRWFIRAASAEVCRGGHEDGAVQDHNIYGPVEFTHRETTYRVSVRHKVVDGTKGEPLVPSTTKPKFEVSLTDLAETSLQDLGRRREEVLIAPNDLGLGAGSFMSPSSMDNGNSHPSRAQYVVLGLGKTATDAVVHLLTKMDVQPADIQWVVPQDVFMFVRPRYEDLQWDLRPWKMVKNIERWFYQGGMAPSTSFLEALLESDGDADKAWSMLEDQGVATRVLTDSYDKGMRPPRVSRSAMIDRGEVALTRSIPRDNLIREGRVESLAFIPQHTEATGQEDIRSGRFELTFQNKKKRSFHLNTVFVDCTSPGPFPTPEFLSKLPDMFTSDRLLTLGAIFLPPISWSMATLAEIETARRLHQLDGEALIQMAKMAVQIPLDEPGVALTGTTSEFISSASPPSTIDPQCNEVYYSQRPGESFENFALRALLRQGPLALKDPARFAVLRKEAIIYVMLGPRKFRNIAEDNRLSQSAFRSFMFENIRAGAPFRRGVYEWMRDLRRKCDEK